MVSQLVTSWPQLAPAKGFSVKEVWLQGSNQDPSHPHASRHKASWHTINFHKLCQQPQSNMSAAWHHDQHVLQDQLLMCLLELYLSSFTETSQAFPGLQGCHFLSKWAMCSLDCKSICRILLTGAGT